MIRIDHAPNKVIKLLKQGKIHQCLISHSNALNRFHHIIISRVSGDEVIFVHYLFEKNGDLFDSSVEETYLIEFELDKSNMRNKGIHLEPTTPETAKIFIQNAISYAKLKGRQVPNIFNIINNVFYDVDTSKTSNIQFTFED
jgi:hypothetical protein